MRTPFSPDFEAQNLVVEKDGILCPGPGWLAIDGMFRARTMIRPLGTFLGHIMSNYGITMPSEIESNAAKFLDISQPPLSEEERALYLSGILSADEERAKALQEWRTAYFDKQPVWAERERAQHV